MSGLQSNTDALLIAIPMLVFLLAGMFRLDELVGKPRKRGPQRRPMAAWTGGDYRSAWIRMDGYSGRGRGARPEFGSEVRWNSVAWGLRGES